jgi:hypothetical protein
MSLIRLHLFHHSNGNILLISEDVAEFVGF